MAATFCHSPTGCIQRTSLRSATLFVRVRSEYTEYDPRYPFNCCAQYVIPETSNLVPHIVTLSANVECHFSTARRIADMFGVVDMTGAQLTDVRPSGRPSLWKSDAYLIVVTEVDAGVVDCMRCSIQREPASLSDQRSRLRNKRRVYRHNREHSASSDLGRGAN